MTRKEAQTIIDQNPGKQLYALYGNGFMTVHEPVSKTRILRNAKLFHSVRVSTFLEERTDLDPKRVSNGEQMIVTFDAIPQEKANG